MIIVPSRRRWLWTVAFIVVICVLIAMLVRPGLHLLSTTVRDPDELAPPEPGYTDDASRLNETPVARIWPVPQDSANAEAQLAEVLSQARRDGLAVSIAGARHSMGGHTMYPGGVVIDMLPFNGMQLDEQDNVLRKLLARSITLGSD